MEKAVIYARYSSDSQRDASIDQQVKACEQYAIDQGYEVLRIYQDRALTGKTDKRPDFLRMIRDSGKQDFSFVIVYALDRFSRNKYDSAIYKQKLKENGVRVLSAMEHITDDPTGQLMESILEGFAQYYSDELSQKIHRGLTDNAEKGIVNGSVPLGYRRGADGHAEIVPEEAEIVREIFRRVRTGEQLIRIVEDLNRRGVKTKKGAQWNKSSFNRLLSNERYIGVYLYKEFRIEGGFPAIIDEETFRAVQTVVLEKPQGRGTVKRRKCEAFTYLLTGKLWCGECDSPMSGISGTSRSGGLCYYYTCTKKRYEKSCHKKNVPRDLIEQAITRELRQLLEDDDLLEWMADRAIEHLESERNTAELDAVREQLREATAKRDNLRKNMETGGVLPIVMQWLNERQQEIADLTARLHVLEKQNEISITRDMILSFLEALRDGDVSDRKYQEMLIDAFLVRAYVFDDGRLKLIFNYTKNHGKKTISLEAFDDDPVHLSSSELHLTGHRRTVRMIDGYFVCDVPNAV